MLSGCWEAPSNGYFFFFLVVFFAFFAFFAFLAMVPSVVPKSWFDANRRSMCIGSAYTIIAKLILRASKRVNGHQPVCDCRPDEALARCADMARLCWIKTGRSSNVSGDEADDCEAEPPLGLVIVSRYFR